MYLLSSICAFAHILEMMIITYSSDILLLSDNRIIKYRKLYVDVIISNNRYFGRNDNIQYF